MTTSIIKKLEDLTSCKQELSHDWKDITSLLYEVYAQEHFHETQTSKINPIIG
jgi:hypothetical protein